MGGDYAIPIPSYLREGLRATPAIHRVLAFEDQPIDIASSVRPSSACRSGRESGLFAS